MEKKLKLQLIKAFGISNANIPQSFSIVNENSLIYFIQSSLVWKNIQTREYKYFYKENTFQNIKLVETYTDENDRPFVAVLEDKHTFQSQSTIQLYTKQKRGIFEHKDKKLIKITILSLSQNKWNENQIDIPQNAKVLDLKINQSQKILYFLYNIENQEEFTLVAWNYKKKKRIAKHSTKNEYMKVTIHPVRVKNILLFSQTSIRMFELKTQNKNFVEKSLLLHSKSDEDEKYLDYCWNIQKKVYYLVVLCNNNSIALLQEDKFLKKIRLDLSIVSFITFSISNNQKSSFREILNAEEKFEQFDQSKKNIEKAKMVKLLQLEKGFMIVTNNFYFCICKIHKLKKQEDFMSNNLIYILQSYYLDFQDEQQKFLSVTTNLKSSFLTITSSNKDKQQYNSYLLDAFSIDNSKSPLRKFFQTGLHNNKIERISAARTKSLFVTLSQGQARIWGLNEETDDKNLKLIQSDKNDDVFVDIAIHPFGFTLILALFTGFKVFQILDDKLQLIKEVELVWCSVVKYSSRARYFLANEKNNICVFDAIHYNLIFVFKSHSKLIRNFIILEDQYRVISHCNGGDIMMWEIVDKPKITEQLEQEHKDVVIVHKHSSESIYIDYVYHEKRDLLIGTSESHNIVVYSDNCKKLALQYKKQDCVFESLQLDQKKDLLYCGTNKGSIRVFDVSNLDYKEEFVAESLPFMEIKICSSPISSILLMQNNTQIVVAEEFGSILCFEMLDYKSNTKEENNQLETRNNVNEIAEQSFLISNYKLKEEKNNIKYLQSEIQRLRRVKIIERDNLKKEFKKVILMIEQKFKQNLKDDQKLHNSFWDQLKKKQEEKNIEFENLNAQNQKVIQEITQKTEFLVNYEKKKNKELQERYDKLIEQKENQTILMKADHDQKLEQLKQNMEQEVQDVQKHYDDLQKRLELFNKKFEQKINLEEQEYEREVEAYTMQLEKELKKEEAELQKIQEENKKLQSENKVFWKEDKQRQKQIERLVVENTVLLEQKVKLCLSLLKMQEQLLEKEQVIENKQNTIQQSKEVQNSLENFRFILEDKIKNFQDEKSVFMQKIQLKEKYMKELFQDLLEQSQLNHILFKNYQKNFRIQSLLSQQIENQDKENIRVQYMTGIFLKNLFRIFNQKKSKTDLRLALKTSLEQFLEKDINRVEEIKEDKIDIKYEDCNELIRETEQLSGEIEKVLKTTESQKIYFKHKIMIGIGKNKNLIEECNKLREENVYYLKILKELRQNLQLAKQRKPLQINNANFDKKLSYNNPYAQKKSKQSLMKSNLLKSEFLFDCQLNYKNQKKQNINFRVQILLKSFIHRLF